MLCSICNKNPAVIFVNKIENGQSTMEGLCINCAKEKGINPEEALGNNINMEQMNKQIESMLQSLTENMDDIGENSEFDDDPNGAPAFAAAIPLGSIFSGMFGNNNKNPDIQKNAENSHSKHTKKEEKKSNNISKKKKYLDSFGTNITSKAKNNELDMVIGREKELERIIQILNRRSKNNPCLIGEPGVGKTALAHALAIKIATGNVPPKLLNKEVYLLDITAVVAGTQFRGQFEARMKGILEECKSFGNIILVIDEIHNLIGAGDSDHSMNAANILKPSLANGDIQLIGTTTLKEYRKYIEKDSALERRFQQVLVEEPNIEDTIEILEGIKKYYEEFHKVQISKDVLTKTVEMSEKYIHDRFLPDKALDILDEACSRINLDNKELYELEILNRKLEQIQIDKQELADNNSEENFQKIADLKTTECQLTEQINQLNSNLVIRNLTINDIAQVIESWTKIPVTKITETETHKLLSLEDNLHKRIVGQHEAVSSVARTIRRKRAGLQSTKRPPSFIFVGPTGVGKTELAKALAFEMFGSEEAIIRVDMSEYMESHSTSKLIGAPPGYVGYDDAGQLTDKVKRKPYSIILLDEIEKAHPDVFNILLQVLDDGKLTDAQGNTVSFEHTIIIMTSNAGSNSNNYSLGFGKETIDENKLQYSLKETFRPEFLNRIDEIIIFKPLVKEELLTILNLMLESTSMALKDKNITLKITNSAKNYILLKGTNFKYGARPLRRSIQKYIEDEISEMILKSELQDGNTIKIDFDNEMLKFTPIKNNIT